MTAFSKVALMSPKTSCSIWRDVQATLISNSSQKRREAVERRMVTEDVIK
jgi:hypothetical protein